MGVELDSCKELDSEELWQKMFAYREVFAVPDIDLSSPPIWCLSANKR